MACQVPEGEEAYTCLTGDGMEAIYENTSVCERMDKKATAQNNLSTDVDQRNVLVPHDNHEPGEYYQYKYLQFAMKNTPLWLTLLLGILLIIVAVVAVVGLVLAYNVHRGWFTLFY